jgi:predicted small metal-binding protein
MLEVICPACGALIEGDDGADLVQLAQDHTRDAHSYVVSADHVLARAVPAGTS